MKKVQAIQTWLQKHNFELVNGAWVQKRHTTKPRKYDVLNNQTFILEEVRGSRQRSVA